ncbi:hypothetical protein ACH4U5_31390 [Streptomyces sp. NPDC020858]|uniref:hypothetical protein n=1 Tax=Streptomyces sp. NPDC020858 TaxID=3365097 RepID=UPI0037A6B05B
MRSGPSARRFIVLRDVFNGSLGEFLGGLALAALLALLAWGRRRRAIPPDGPGAGAARQARRYTLIGTRAPGGHPVQIISTRPVGTVVKHRGPAGPEDFELTNAVLFDGTYAAEPLDRYR